jgi:Tfp pilus assembly protein PilO
MILLINLTFQDVSILVSSLRFEILVLVIMELQCLTSDFHVNETKNALSRLRVDVTTLKSKIRRSTRTIAQLQLSLARQLRNNEELNAKCNK